MNRSHRRLIVLLACALVAVALGVVLLNRDKTDPDPQTEKLDFRLKWLVYSGFAPHFVALEKGFYEDQGLTVEIKPGGPGIDPLKLVLTGEADVGLASYDQILLARAKGLPLIAIGEDTTKSGVGFLALKSSGITKPEDFVGRKVGVMPGTDKGTMYEALMSKLKIDRTSITETPVQFNLAVLLNGTVEVFPSFITNQPIAARQKGFEVNVIDPYNYGIRPGGNVFFTTEKTLSEKRELLLRFLRAELKAVEASVKMQPEEVVDCVLKHNSKLDRETELKIWIATRDMLLPDNFKDVGIMAETTWKHTAEIFHQTGLLETIPPLSECFTNELVREIHSAKTK